ncbi:FCRLA protein, partial [Drymodes brunneopygia]|nr:FCRLA protein [Drymodes brunneopygia]
LVLQGPAGPLLEGDTMTLRCRGWKEWVSGVQFYHDKEALWGPHGGTELSLSPLQLQHSGRYHCTAKVGSKVSRWEESVKVTVTVKGEHPHS